MANKIKSGTGSKRTVYLNIRITEETAENLKELKSKLNHDPEIIFTNSDVVEILINRCYHGDLLNRII